MSKYELKLPKMGESVAEATITNWLKEVGDTIEMDEAVLEIATDKVDSEIPSEIAGVLVEKFFQNDEVVKVGQTLAIIEANQEIEAVSEVPETVAAPKVSLELEAVGEAKTQKEAVVSENFLASERFYSPLVKNIAKEENISFEELEKIMGSGKDGRVTKDNLLQYLQNRNSKSQTLAPVTPHPAKVEAPKPISNFSVASGGNVEIIEMDRMRRLISQHMIHSVQTSAHVQSFVEVDVTNLVKWRDKTKVLFEKREGEKLTFTPLFVEAVAKALRDFPMINISVEGDKIIRHKNINIGMAAALPSGNLIVPVIKNADQLNLVGTAKKVNDLADRARNNKLKPDDTQDGTYTITNVGNFGSVMGTPIINQPQVGILAFGVIRKMPAVIETPDGDFIGIRQKMFLSHSYDHRVVDGALGGMFVRKVADYLEAWDVNREI
ncbi:MAG: diapophytoene dehydrogenase [Flavobacteriales bacterium CG_4_9_14_3_um_filter_40_17]|nr:MAG: diapophytoene dehydrogenase [Flavobacteriales bacterium CG_4_9_14_3_um_filter_40_17]